MNSAFRILVVNARSLVLDFALIGERAESPGKVIGRPNLLLVFLCYLDPKPFPQSRRAFANIHGHQERRAARHAHQLAHGRFPLEVQSAQHAFF